MKRGKERHVVKHACMCMNSAGVWHAVVCALCASFVRSRTTGGITTARYQYTCSAYVGLRAMSVHTKHTSLNGMSLCVMYHQLITHVHGLAIANVT